MIRHYITVGLRNLRKYPAQTAISVLGLAAGFVCLSLSALWIHYENTYDTMHKDYERIYTFVDGDNLKKTGVASQYTRLQTTSALVKKLQDEHPEVEDVAYCYTSSQTFIINGLEARRMAIDSTFIRMFDLSLVQGDYGFLANRKTLEEIAITEEFAQRLFPGETDVVGKEVVIFAGGKLKIGAVVKGFGEHSIFQFDFLHTEQFEYFMLSPQSLLSIFAKVYETANVDSLAADVKQFSIWGTPQNIATIPITDAHKLAGNFLSLSWEHLRVFLACSALLIVCALINYLVLYLIRLRSREREMALRIVNGSTVGGLMTMFLIEVAIVLLAAILLGVLGVEWLYGVFTRFAQIDMDYGYLFGSAFLIMLATAVLCFLFCILPIAIVRNRTLTGRTRRNDTFRKASSFVQLTVSMVFIFCTVVMLRQIVFMKNTDWGFAIKGRAQLHVDYVVDPSNPHLYNYGATNETLEGLLHRLHEMPMVTEAKREYDFNFDAIVQNKDYMGLSPQSLDVYTTYYPGFWDIGHPMHGFSVVEGVLPRKEAWQSNEVVITEKVRKDLGLYQAVGHTVYTRPDRGYPYTDNSVNQFTIVAVIKDIYYQSPTHEPIGFVFFPQHTNKDSGIPNFLTIAFIPGEREEFESRVHELMEDDYPEAEYRLVFFEDTFNDKIKSETNLMTILGIITAVCILVAVFGVYSIVTLACAQRRKEIALRKIHGATLADILSIFIKEYGLIVLAASAVAFPIGYMIMKEWVAQYVKQAPIAWWIYAVILLAIVLLIALSVGSRVWCTARENPAEVIKRGN